MARPEISRISIYTIVHPDKLAAAATKAEASSFRERKPWITGRRLWREAEASGAAIHVLFGDATDCSRLVYWGVLTKVLVDKKTKTTQYFVKQVRKLKNGHTPQELVLSSSGKRIAPNFIYPYAICRTPPFLLRSLAGLPHKADPAPLKRRPRSPGRLSGHPPTGNSPLGRLSRPSR